jgi:hypothetical protein
MPMTTSARLVLLLALATSACSSQTLDRCHAPACGPEDQVAFAECVANGLDGIEEVCQAGNRACCARETWCEGMLDDQTIHYTRECPEEELQLDGCYRPCTAEDAVAYDLCLGMGLGACAIGDSDCCALGRLCLGDLHDIAVVGTGDCCTQVDDCEAGDHCSTAFECTPGPGCGDRIVQTDEQCDDGNQSIETCAYGPSSCVICMPGCIEVEGEARWCGNEVVDDASEECDPPNGRTCSDTCQSMVPTHDCTDGEQNGDETDVDCGGTECGHCAIGDACIDDTDCASDDLAMCLAFGCVPDAAGGALACAMVEPCDAGNACTENFCLIEEDCYFERIAADGDGFGPGMDCGNDCNDSDASVNPRARELCNSVDDDCDMRVDEACTFT